MGGRAGQGGQCLSSPSSRIEHSSGRGQLIGVLDTWADPVVESHRIPIAAKDLLPHIPAIAPEVLS